MKKTIIIPALVFVFLGLTPTAWAVGVQPSDLALLSNGSFYVGRNSNVTGSVAATSSLDVDRRTTIDGSLYSSGSVWVSNTSTVTGSVYSGPSVEVPVVSPGVVPVYTGGPNSWISNNRSVTLSPGSYGWISTGRNVDIALSAGEYFMGNVWLGNNSILSLDTSAGDITLNIFDGFSTGRDVEFDVIGDGNVYVNVYEGDFWMGDDAILNAAVSVYDGTFGVGSNSWIYGSAQASGNISIGRGTTVTYHRPSPSAIPEPVTAYSMFGAIGALGWYVKKRDRKKK